MGYKGWVYIITNKAFPDLIKIGYTLKDPALRALELNNTGVPHPYSVLYEVMVVNPRDIERLTHRSLSSFREGKEWFKCSVEIGIKEIRKHVGDELNVESIKNTNSLELNNAKKDPVITQVRRLQTVKKYSGKCARCDEKYTVTLTHYDAGARCPHCLSFNLIKF